MRLAGAPIDAGEFTVPEDARYAKPTRRRICRLQVRLVAGLAVAALAVVTLLVCSSGGHRPQDRWTTAAEAQPARGGHTRQHGAHRADDTAGCLSYRPTVLCDRLWRTQRTCGWERRAVWLRTGV
jgi:hypothetical protein